MTPTPLTAIVECTHGELFLYDNRVEQPSYLDAVAAANANGLTVGQHDGVIDVFLPHTDALVRVDVRTLPCAPPSNPAADHIVGFDISLPSGQLTVEGGYGDIPATVGVAPGVYRARMSGIVVDSRIAGVNDEHRPRVLVYELDLWVREDVPEPPAEVRRWHGHLGATHV